MYKYTYRVAGLGRFTPLVVVVFASGRSEAYRKMTVATKAGSETPFTNRSTATIISIEEVRDV